MSCFLFLKNGEEEPRLLLLLELSEDELLSVDLPDTFPLLELPPELLFLPELLPRFVLVPLLVGRRLEFEDPEFVSGRRLEFGVLVLVPGRFLNDDLLHLCCGLCPELLPCSVYHFCPEWTVCLE